MKEESRDIPIWIQSLNHPDKKTVRQAANALIARAQELPELSVRLEQLLTEVPQEQRWPIAYVVGHTASPSPACLHVLQETLDSHDPDLRWAAGSLLMRLGKTDPRIPEMLLALLETGTSTQKRMAVYSLRDLHLKEGAVLTAFLAALKDTDPLVRTAAVLSIKLQSDLRDSGLDSLVDLSLSDPDSRVRCAAVFSLAALGLPTDKISAALKTAAESQDPRLKKAGEAALELLKKKARHRPDTGNDGGPSVD